jgi:hypothetical protein
MSAVPERRSFNGAAHPGPERDRPGDAPDPLTPVTSSKKYHIPRRAINIFPSKIFLIHPLDFPPLFW